MFIDKFNKCFLKIYSIEKKMKISKIIFLCILYPNLLFGQDKNKIEELRAIVDQINIDSTLIIEEIPTEFGKLTKYSRGGKLLKVSESFSLECCNRIDQYYFHDLKLIFLESKHINNHHLNQPDSCNKLIQTPGRKYYYYFDDDRVIYSLDLGHKICKTKGNDASLESILTLSKKYLKEFIKD